MIRAILRAQLLSMRFRAHRRGLIFSLLVGTFWYGFWTAIAWVAEYLAAGGAGPEAIRQNLAAALMLLMLYWQLSPIMSASFGAGLDLRKLLVYPVPRGGLFLVEVVLRTTAAAEVLLVLAGGFIGLVRNPVLGGWTAAARVALPLLLFVAFNLLLAAGLRSVIERVLSYRRVREVLLLLLVTITALPRLLMAWGVRFETVERFFSAGHHILLPWVAAAESMLGRSYIAPVAVLAGWSAAAWAFGRWQFARNLRFDAQAAQSAEAADPRSQSARIGERIFRLPGTVLPDPLAAVVEKELRSLARTPRFRTVFMMGFSFGLVVWLPFIIGRGAVRHAEVAENFLVIVSVYALLLLGQVSYWNAFGFDRSAAQVYFALPVPFGQALAGKNIAAALAILLEVSAVTAACLLLHVPIPGAKIVEAYTVTPVAALYMLAMGNMSSVNFPRAMNPERVSQGGGATRFQGLLFMLYPLALLPVGLAYLARYAFGSELSFYMVLALAAAVGLAAYWIGLESAVAAAHRRREEIIAELTKGEGPVIGG